MSGPSAVFPLEADVVTVVPAPGDGPGNWSGAPSVVLAGPSGGTFWLAWRERRPLDEGRGVAVRLARSDDGVTLEPVGVIDRERFGAESLERPALVPLPDGRWRILLSSATPGSKHWWIDSLTADTMADLPAGERAMVLPGGATTGVKDPVVRRAPDGSWQMFVCCHPLDVPGAEDRMTTRLFTSADAVTWVDRGEVLAGTPGSWDARGARVTAVDPGVAVMPDVRYDGRPDAAANWFETTALARWDGQRYRSVPGSGRRSPHSDGALRYACAVPLPDGGVRWYAERARPDGAHDLVSWTS